MLRKKKKEYKIKELLSCCEFYPRFHYDEHDRPFIKCQVCDNRSLTQLSRLEATDSWNQHIKSQSKKTGETGEHEAIR